jgi:erythritol transport system substrate-binding protein
MALGAVAALKSAGLTDKVKVVGFDGSPDVISAIKKNQVQATVLQPAALIAQMAVEQADEYVKNGKASKPEKQSIDCELVNKANASQFGVFEKTA